MASAYRENLSTAMSLIKKKKRQALSADKKAYKIAYQIKGVKRGNNRKRSPRPESPVAPVDGGITPA